MCNMRWAEELNQSLIVSFGMFGYYRAFILLKSLGINLRYNDLLTQSTSIPESSVQNIYSKFWIRLCLLWLNHCRNAVIIGETCFVSQYKSLEANCEKNGRQTRSCLNTYLWASLCLFAHPKRPLLLLQLAGSGREDSELILECSCFKIVPNFNDGL